MRRGYLLYLEDILACTNKILSYVGERSFEEVIKDDMRLDAIERNFTIMGEAAKNIPNEIRQKYPFVEWQKVTDFRNVLAHEYFGISKKVLWSIIKDKLPILQRDIQRIFEREK